MLRRMLAPLAIIMLLLGSLVGALTASAYHEHEDHTHVDAMHPFADPAFERTWQRTDKPVDDGEVDRTWMWGPSPYTEGTQEPYADSPGGMRQVQYFDKSRMEINDPDAVDDGLWYVTNGLLVVEMMSGMIQVGHEEFVPHPSGPSTENVAGDPNVDETDGPTYATMAMVRDEEPAADGAVIIERLSRDGTITSDDSLASMGVTAARRVTVPGIDHQIANVFIDFMESVGTVYVDGMFVEDRLFPNEFYATGYPVTEPYWTTAMVGGTPHDVLVQCFERRCLTYTPANEEGWRVEAGNVGQHYYRWRHGDIQVFPDESLFVAHLTGAAERPIPVETDASGRAAFFLSDDGTTLRFHITLDSLENVTMAHIHAGTEDVAGPPIIWLWPEVGSSGTPAVPPQSPSVISGEITAEDVPAGMTLFDVVQLMIDGGAYVNVHTTAYPAGEIRGQIMVLDEAAFDANLTNDQEVVDDPANQPNTGATGSSSLLYNREAGTITCEIAVNDIENVTMSHIHVAPAGVNGPVVVWLFPETGPPPADPPVTPEGSLDCTTVTGERLMVPAAVAEAIGGTSLQALVYQMLIGNTYVNVHTTAFPAGEIRGQIAPVY